MGITDIFAAMGGLALFLFGMKLMSDGLELFAGQRLKVILEKLTSNRLSGLLIGLGVTAIIQSSSATTVMAVGFVNAGLMTVKQTVGVIMGANIGTSVTAQMIALNISEIAPIFAFIGVGLIMFTRKDKAHYIGQVIAGLGILFIGMGTMSDAMKPLRTMSEFQSMLTNFEHPLIGVLVGAAFTAIIQSSSASIGILQALAIQNVVTLGSSIYVLCGMNIGTCITAIIASLGANRNAKRVALIHLLFNVLGALIFTILLQFLPAIAWIETLSPGNVPQQIANAHTIFNVLAAAALFPFGNVLADIATRAIPDEAAPGTASILKFIDTRKLGAPSMAISQLRMELERMAGIACDNVQLAMNALIHSDSKDFDDIHANEDIVDALDHEITDYLVRLNQMELSNDDAGTVSAFFHVTSDLERISDHAENILELADVRIKNGLGFSDTALQELEELNALLKSLLKRCIQLIGDYDFGELDHDKLRARIADDEQSVDDLVTLIKNHHVRRVAEGECSADAGQVYMSSLTDIERIGDHAMNISEKM